METIGHKQQDGVALIQLNRGIINAINQQVLDELGEALKVFKDDPMVHGLVLTSSNDKFFSIGFDLPELYPLPQQEFGVFYQAFNHLCLDLYTFPKPTIAAITGHATAGGCILALCTDYRFMAEGRTVMGLNESKLEVPITYLADCLLNQLVGEDQARQIVSSGELYPPEDALEMGMVDQLYSSEEVISATARKIRDLGMHSLDAFGADKRLRVHPIESQVRSNLEKEIKLFLERWYAPEARQLLGNALSKFTPKD
ncbi:MAG: enoyl-CoA hydratase/isomerase family protein [Deltaproteobacteria bacterium]|nr:enoyl-CoA hydratase/isomerase family protein [Deltaproteobacteria bacterium]